MNGEGGGHKRNELKKGGTNETHEKETEWCDVHHLYTGCPKKKGGLVNATVFALLHS